MRLLNKQIFDEVIKGTDHTWYTSEELNAEIGAAERFRIQARTTGVVTGTRLTVQAEVSADNINWIATSGSPQIDDETVANDGSYSGNAGDFVLCYTRFKISLAGSGPPECRLKLFMTGRVFAG